MWKLDQPVTHLMWLFFQVMMWKTVETRKRAHSPRPYTQAVSRSQPVFDRRCSSAMPTKAGTTSSWRQNTTVGIPASNTAGTKKEQRRATSHRVGVEVSSVFIAGGLVATVGGGSSVHEPAKHNETMLAAAQTDHSGHSSRWRECLSGLRHRRRRHL